ncbi:hemoglobin subunit beta-1 [Patella vulgata]|uniref:hemoglobin subunit beta-1 n=1 Tax=Patella vulgata TaxID=6465 RepID=UPI00217F9D3D|nr:hemoglobin subunit beta-1 [Patella vulgata]
MGCGGSKTKNHKHLISLLTEDDKHNLQHSWRHFTSQDVVEGGMDIFFYIFKKHPEVKELFHFVGNGETSESLKSNHRFRSHVGLFCETIRIAVEEIRDLEDILIFLRDLGNKHNLYGATPKYIETAGEGINHALRKRLGKKFTSEVESSWNKFYKILAASMIKGMQEDKVTIS